MDERRWSGLADVDIALCLAHHRMLFNSKRIDDAVGNICLSLHGGEWEEREGNRKMTLPAMTSGDGAVSLTVRDTASFPFQREPFPATAGDMVIDDAVIDSLTRERRGAADYDGYALDEIAAASAAALATAPPTAPAAAVADQAQPSERTGFGPTWWQGLADISRHVIKRKFNQRVSG